MKRKLFFNNKQLMQRYSNDIETFKDEYRNEIAKVYQINTHGKFTVIVRSSFVRLHVYPTTTMDPCDLLDLSVICDSEMSSPPSFNLDYDRKPERRRKTWKPFDEKVRKRTKNQVTSTLIIHSSTTQTKHLPIISEQKHPSYGLFVLFLVICILIIGFILWYIFTKTSHSHKSTLHLASEAGDSDDQYQIRRLDNSETDLNSSRSDQTIDSLLSDGMHYTKDRNKKDISVASETMTFDLIRNHDEKINYENVQFLIENLQQSNFESINSSIMGRILSDLIHQAVNVAYDINSNPRLSTDLQTFLLYAPQFFRMLRTTMTNKHSCDPSNPTNFLQCQYLIDILHNSEIILEHLHQNHPHDSEFLVKILSHLYQILSTMDDNSSQHRSICQSLSNILEKLDQQQHSSL